MELSDDGPNPSGHFDSTVKHWLIYFLHSCTDAMEQVPCGPSVLTPDRSLELACAHALLGLYEQQDGHKPDRQGQVGIVEYGSGGNGELVTALAARELLARVNPPNIPVAATRAFNAFGPAQAGENLR
jgi:hypothetical protein